jgi:hypothetical protein
LRLLYRGNAGRPYGEPLVLADRMSQLIDLAPAVREARPDDDVSARLALWLAEVSADAARAARGDGNGPAPEQPEPE